MKLAVFGRTLPEEVVGLIQSVFDFFTERRIDVFCEEDYLKLLFEKNVRISSSITFKTHQDLMDLSPDFLISIGGDGTLLHTVALVRDSEMPVLGIHTGRMGFLTGINKNELFPALEDFIEKKFRVEKRLLMHLETNSDVFRDLNFALNDVCIRRDEKCSTIGIHVKINGENLTTFWADGLIIATPSGSTAYSLACGGPILMPQSQTWVLTPIAPHNLTVRPLVIPANSGLEITVESRSGRFYLGLDAQVELVENSTKIHITKEVFNFNTLHFKPESFSRLIQEKLFWGRDKRNSG